MFGGSIASSITNNQYSSFTFNPNGNTLDLSRLSLDYNAENPFAFTLGVFASTDGGVTGFAASDQLFTITLPDTAATTPATLVNTSNFLDLGALAAFQGLNVPVEFRFYLADNSSLATRVHSIDNVRLTALASTVNDPNWNINANGSWNAGGGWDPTVVPAAGSSVVFGDVISTDRTVTLNANVSANRISFSSQNGAYTIAPAAAQSITLTGDGELRATGSQEHVIAARISGTAGLTKEGAGEVTLTNVTNNYTGGVDIQGGTLGATNTGALQGAVSVASGAVLRFDGNSAGGGYNGVFANALSGAGTAVLSDNLTTETVNLNAAKGFDGVYLVEGGTLAVSNAGAFGTGGTNANRTAVRGDVSTGKLAISGNIAVANELLALSGRTTDAVQFTSSGANSWGGDIDGRGGADQYNIESTAGTLTLGGRLSATDAVGAPERTFVFSGAGNTVITGQITDDSIADDGTRTASLGSNVSVVKRGAGTLTISTESSDVANYHRGTTVVEQGTLRVTAGAGDVGELSSSRVTVESGAVLNLTDFGVYNMQAQASLGVVQTFGGAGTIVANTFGYFDDGSLSPGDSVGTLTINGGLVMTAFGPTPAGSLNFELSNVTAVGGGVNDLIDVNGPLTVNVPGGNFAVKITPVNGGFATGTYRLIEYNGALGGAGTGANFGVTVVDGAGNAVGATRQSFAVSTGTAGQVNLGVAGSAQNLTWSGTTNGAWDIATTANWNAGAEQFFNLDSVVFDDTATRFNVALAANVLPSEVNFNATVNTYTLTGAGIVGSAPIKINSGTVVLNNAGNSSSGTVTIANGATLRVGAGGADANLLADGETPYVVNGSLILNELSGGETISGPITGSGSVTVQSSQLTLSGDNSGYTGAIVAGDGTTLNIENADTGNPLGGVATGTTLGVGATLTANAQTATVAELVTLNGGVLRAGGGTSSNLNWAGNITIGGAGPAEIRHDGGTDTPTTNGLTVSGNVTGAAGQSLTLRVDAASTTVVTGNLQHNGALLKTQPGRAELRGTNSFTGDTTVSGGTLALIGNSDIASSTRVEVQANGSLDVTGRTGGSFAITSGRTLDNDGAVIGNTSAASGSTISIAGDGAASVQAQTVRFTPPLGSLGSNSDVRVRSGSNANNPQGDTGALSIGSISASDAFRSLLTFDLSSTGISDPNLIESVALTLTLAAPNGAQVNTASAPVLDLFTIGAYNSDTATFNNTPFSSPAATLISSATGPNFAQALEGDTVQWSQSTSGGFFDAVKNAVGGNLYLGSRVQTLVSTRSFYTFNSAETTTIGAAPSLAITFTDPNNPLVTGVGSALFEGDLSMAAGSTLEVDVFDTSAFDQLDVNGVASLGGTLSVNLLDPTRVSINDTFTILTANNIVNNLTLGGPDGAMFNLSASTPTSLVLTYVGAVASLPGDFNGDLIVDAADYTVWRDNLGSTEGTLLNGNGNGGVIDQSDYTLWKSNFGAVLASAALNAAVPEPGAAALALLACLGASCVRRRS